MFGPIYSDSFYFRYRTLIQISWFFGLICTWNVSLEKIYFQIYALESVLFSLMFMISWICDRSHGLIALGQMWYSIYLAYYLKFIDDNYSLISLVSLHVRQIWHKSLEKLNYRKSQIIGLQILIFYQKSRFVMIILKIWIM